MQLAMTTQFARMQKLDEFPALQENSLYKQYNKFLLS